MDCPEYTCKQGDDLGHCKLKPKWLCLIEIGHKCDEYMKYLAEKEEAEWEQNSGLTEDAGTLHTFLIGRERNHSQV